MMRSFKTLVIIFTGCCAIVEGSTEDAFEQDLLIWGLKNRIINKHKTKAFYSRPLELDSGSAGLDRNTLFESPPNGEIWATASDYYAKRFYYTDHSTNFIGVYDLKTKEHLRVFEGMAWGIDGLSVDWVSGNVYWIDTHVNWIMVADRNFTNYRNLIPIKSKVVAKVAVDPNNRYLYWSERRENDCRIRRSDLQGYNLETVRIIPEAQFINDMKIDFVNHRLYWIERLRKRGGVSRVQYIDLAMVRREETTHEVYKEGNTEFFGLASYKNHLYVTDLLNKKLLVISKGNKRVVHQYEFKNTETPRGITAYSGYEHPLTREDENHQCKSSTCEHLCLARYGINQFSCECRIGFELRPDGRSCRSDIVSDNFAIVLDGKHSKMYQMNLQSASEPQEIQVSGIIRPSSVDYDWLTRTVYWSDERTRTISRSSVDGRNQRVLVNDSTVTSIALDPLAGNMYWIDSEKDAMFVAKMNGSHTRTLHIEDLHIVWGVTIDPSRRHIYWSDWGQKISTAGGGTISVIKSSRLDGSDVKTIANPGTAPRGLALDPERNILFWSQIADYSIEWVNLNDQSSGKYEMPFGDKESILGVPMITGLAYWQDSLYVSDQGRSHVLTVAVDDVINPINRSSHSEQVRPFGSAIFYRPSGIYTFDSNLAKASTGSVVCVNSDCPHLCIPVHTGGRVVSKCVCQDHFKYVAGNNTCVQESSTSDTTPPSFGHTCPESRVVIADKCSDEAEVFFVDPTATDDSNFPIALKRLTVIPKMPTRLKEGKHTYEYKASDRSHNEARCRFTIEVQVRRCHNVYSEIDETLPYSAELGEPSCGEKVGSVVNVTCHDIPGIAYQYECLSNLEWTPLGLETCDPISTTAAPRSAESTPQSTSAAAAKTSTHVLATSTAKKIVDSATTAASTPLLSSSLFIQQLTTNDSLHGSHSSQNQNGSNTPALIAGIVISILLLLAIVVIVVILYRRKRKPCPPGTNWNRIEDRVQLTGASTESGIYVGDEQPLTRQNGKIVT